MSILLTIVTQWYYHSLVSEDASVSSLPHPHHLTRHRAPFYLQNISQLRLDIPIPAAQLEAVMVAQQSWLSHEWTADTLLSVPISYCPLHSCQIDLRKTQPGSIQKRTVEGWVSCVFQDTWRPGFRFWLYHLLALSLWESSDFSSVKWGRQISWSLTILRCYEVKSQHLLQRRPQTGLLETAVTVIYLFSKYWLSTYDVGNHSYTGITAVSKMKSFPLMDLTFSGERQTTIKHINEWFNLRYQ